MAADRFVRGDGNSDGSRDITDAIFILRYLFTGDATPSCLDAADTNDTGDLDLTDSVYLLNYLFLGGPSPKAPFPDCGSDPTPDTLDCEGPTPCPDASVVMLVRTSPAQGEIDVAVTRETVLEFDGALAPETASGAVRALFGTEDLAFRLHVSPDRRRLTLFYADPLPASSRIRVEVDGTRLRSADERPVDLDGDSAPGDVLLLEFETLSTTRFPGTHVCGRVFASELEPSPEGIVDVNTPLAGVRITVDGLEDELIAVTDALGNFRLEDAPAGRFFVHIDGRSATNPVPEGAYYPFVGKAWKTAPGVETTVGEIYLPLVDPGTLQEVSETEDTIVGFPDSVVDEFPEFADVTLTVPADSLYSDDGTRGGMVGIAPVSPDRLPGTLPPGLRLPLVITVQTDGATNFDRPAAVCFPNLPDPETGEVLTPGAKSALWSFNHDTGRFEVVGSMTVSADGRLVCSDPGVGIRAPGWHGVAPGATGPGNCSDESFCGADQREPPCTSCDCPRPPAQPSPHPPHVPMHKRAEGLTDPVYLHSGEMYADAEDLRIRGRGFDFIWARKYRSQVGPNTAQGNRWDFSYNVSVEKKGQLLVVRDGNGRTDRFFPLEPDSPDFDRAGFFHEIHAGDGPWTITFPDGGRWEFPNGGGRIQASADRNGNRMTFHYDGEDRLVRITDTLDRDVEVVYSADGFIASVTDFAGRTVRYDYYDANEPGGTFGDLKSVTTPLVLGTPNGNDFPQGKITTYTYDGQSQLLTVTDGRRNDPRDATFGEGPYLVNTYSRGRVVRQTWGGDVVDLVYTPLEPKPENDFAEMRATVNDRQGNVKEFLYHRGYVLKSVRQYTGRADPRSPTNESTNRPQGKLRPEDPAFFLTETEYNEDSLPVSMILPNRNRVEFSYETGSQRERANLIAVRRTPGGHSPPGDQAVIEEFFEYDADFGGCCGYGLNFVTRHVDGRGNETLHDYDERGNRIQTTHRIPSIVEDFEYNEFGQLTARVLPDNGQGHRRRDEFIYYDSGPQRGYLHQMVIDSENFALTYTFAYDAVGNLVRIVDPRGDETLLVVNQLNQVVRVTTPEVEAGSGLRYEYDLSYDANDNLTRVEIQNVDDQGTVQANTHLTTVFEYEILNRLVRLAREVDSSRSAVTEYEYDGNRNLTLIRSGEATNGNQPENTVRFLWDERDLLFQHVRAEGHPSQSTTQLDYDRNGNLRRTRQGLEDTPRVTTRTHDGYDRLVERIDPMGNSTVYDYDANSNRIGLFHEGELDDGDGDNGNVRLYHEIRLFDALDRLTRRDVRFFDTETQDAIADGLSTTEIEYSDNSQIVSVTNDNGHQSRAFYDTANRVMEIVDHLGNNRNFTYDRDSNVLQIKEVDRSDLGRDPQAFTTMYEYDGLERVVRLRDSVGNTTRFGYDSRNNLTTTTDPLGNVIRRSFDGLNRAVAVTRILTDNGTGGGNPVEEITTSQVWDDSSRLVGRTDDNGNTCAYDHDPLNRMVALTYADGTARSYEYDVHDNVTTTAEANGSVTTSTYDLLDRLVHNDVVPGPGVSADTTFEVFGYDGLSRLVRAEDDDSVVTRAYDSLSSVLEETLQGQATGAIYDGVGNRLSCTYPGGRTVTCTYDGLERKKTVSDSGGSIASYFYVGPDRMERCDLGNGTRTDVLYDGIIGIPNPAGDFGVRKAIRTTHTRIVGGTVVDDRAYRWDRLYNKVERKDMRPGGSGLVESFAYDSAYRLVASVRTGGGGPVGTVDYALDGVGNRTSVTGGANAGKYAMSATLPEPGDRQCNQYTQTGFDSRLYDPNGNLVTIDVGLAGERAYRYDYANRLVGFADAASATQARYGYDALGRRIERVVDSGGATTTRYFYSGWQVVEEQNGAGDTEASYVYGRGIDEVVQMQRGSADFFFHADDLHSVTALTDAAGNVVERYEYGDFGEPLLFDASGTPRAQSAARNPHLFTGRRHDPETGWYYYRTRYLDPRAGRFTSRDTIDVWGDPGNLGNAFAYVGNRPWTLVDPMGWSSGDPYNPDRPEGWVPPKQTPIERPGAIPPTPTSQPTSSGTFQEIYPEIWDSAWKGGLSDMPPPGRSGPQPPGHPSRPIDDWSDWLEKLEKWEREKGIRPAECKVGPRARPGLLARVPSLAARLVRLGFTALGVLGAGTADTEGEALLLSLPLLATGELALPLGLVMVFTAGRLTVTEAVNALDPDDPDDLQTMMGIHMGSL